MTVTRSDVEALSSMGWDHLPDESKDALLIQAQTEATTIYSERVSTLPTLEGDEDEFVKLLAAHKWELAEGGEAQSENSSGGSVTYNTVTGEAMSPLTQTRYGREALKHLRSNASIGVVRTR